MFRLNSIFRCFIVFTLFFSCKKETIKAKIDYNRKANELIQQVILDNSSNCILEIPKESLIKMYLSENASYDIRTKTIQQLNLRNSEELDSLEKLSINFILDTSFFKQKNINIINRDSSREKIENLILSKTCSSGFLSISKPIFDKNYTTGLIYSTIEPSCLGTFPVVYKYERGKWKQKTK